MKKVVIFDWGGVIMHKHPVENNDRQAIIRTIKSFNPSLTDDEAWDVYSKTLLDENGIYISRQDDELSKRKWVERINQTGNFDTTVEEFAKKFAEEHIKVGYYKELVDFIPILCISLHVFIESSINKSTLFSSTIFLLSICPKYNL